jgi:hypothetical protein
MQTGLLDSKLKNLNTISYDFLIESLKTRNYSAACEFIRQEYLWQGKKIILFGAGFHTACILSMLNGSEKQNIVAILDDAKVGLKIDDFGVGDLSMIANFEFDYIVASSDVLYVDMIKRLLNSGVEQDKIVNIYLSEKFQDYAFFIQDSRIDPLQQLVSKINESANPLVIASNSMTIRHLTMLKYLARNFDLFVVTSSDRIQSILLKDLETVPYLHILASSSEIVVLSTMIEKGSVLTINCMYSTALGSSLSMVSNVPVYAMFIDLLSAFHSFEVASEMCNANLQFFSEKNLWQTATGVIFKENLPAAKKHIEELKPKKYLQFFDYCDDEILLPDMTCSDKVRFVYAGGLVSPTSSDPSFLHQKSIVELVNHILSNDMEVSIYNAYDNGESSGFEFYKKISNSRNYKYNTSILPLNLSRELSNYDVGLIVFDFARNKAYNIYRSWTSYFDFCRARDYGILCCGKQYRSCRLLG